LASCPVDDESIKKCSIKNLKIISWIYFCHRFILLQFLNMITINQKTLWR
jgi:hypothetical protein